MENKSNNKLALWSLLCFFVPFVSLILWLVWKDKEMKKDIKTIAKAGVAGLMVYVFVAIMCVYFMNTFIYILYILLALACLLFMVMVHELGHYIAGRILKFKITEFSIGFGIPLFSITNKRGEKISLRLFPLGGYCAFDGEGDDDDKPKEGSFNSQRPWKRIIVFLAGVTMNFLTAIVFSCILLCTIGYDVMQVKDTSMSYSDGYYVETTGSLQKDDVILAVNGVTVDFAFSKNYNDLIQEQLNTALSQLKDVKNTQINSLDDYKFSFTVRRDGKEIVVDDIFFVEHIVEGNSNPTYSIGVSLGNYVYSFWEALARCVPFAFGLAWIVLKSLWQLVTFQIALKDIGGPVTTVATLASFTQMNPASLLILIPLVSANLAVFNLLPFPALDGSHVLFTTIEAIRKKPINRKVENIIHTVGILILFAFVIIVDILHFLI